MDVTMNSSIEPATVPVRYITGFIHFIILLASTCGNALLMLVLIKGHTQLKSIAFYILASQMLVCDVVGLIVSYTMAMPLTFSGYTVMKPSYAPFSQIYIALVDTIGAFAYMTTILFAMLLTVNRFCIFMAPTADRILFRRPNIFILVGIVWLLNGVLMAIFFCYTMQITTGKGAQGFLSFLLSFLILAQNLIGEYFPVAMIVLYFIIFVKIRWDSGLCRHGKVATQNRRITKLEKAFLIQSFIICAMYEVRYAAFYIMPDTVTGQWPYVMRFLRQSTNVLMLSIHAIVIFCSNAKVREILLQETIFGRFVRFLRKRLHSRKIREAITVSSFELRRRAISAE
ncbi:serpentine type 7TM GPCR chemoreceptor srx domain-containing protein [Ditylenchus destructor]|nr:serpentine type 7TM GPCR chemoreceptor srx domain-containing protein [Ditylenchus destructor]